MPDPVVTVEVSRQRVETALWVEVGGSCNLAVPAANLRAALDSQEGKEQRVGKRIRVCVNCQTVVDPDDDGCMCDLKEGWTKHHVDFAPVSSLPRPDGTEEGSRRAGAECDGSGLILTDNQHKNCPGCARCQSVAGERPELEAAATFASHAIGISLHVLTESGLADEGGGLGFGRQVERLTEARTKLRDALASRPNPQLEQGDEDRETELGVCIAALERIGADVQEVGTGTGEVEIVYPFGFKAAMEAREALAQTPAASTQQPAPNPDQEPVTFEPATPQGLADAIQGPNRYTVDRVTEEAGEEEHEPWTGVAEIAWCPKHGLHGARSHCFECGEPVEQIPMVPIRDLAGIRGTLRSLAGGPKSAPESADRAEALIAQAEGMAQEAGDELDKIVSGSAVTPPAPADGEEGSSELGKDWCRLVAVKFLELPADSRQAVLADIGCPSLAVARTRGLLRRLAAMLEVEVPSVPPDVEEGGREPGVQDG